MDGFAVPCPLVPDVPHLRSGGRACIPLEAGYVAPHFWIGLPCLRQTSSRPRLTLARHSASARRHDDALLSRHSFKRRRLPFLLASGELLTLGSANTWYEDFHLASSVPCPAHTLTFRGGHGSGEFR